MLSDGDKRCGCGEGHETFGQCLRAKSLKIEGCRSATGGPDRTRQKAWDAELQSYRDARAQGIQPATTRTRDIRRAVEISDRRGSAFDAGNPVPKIGEVA